MVITLSAIDVITSSIATDPIIATLAVDFIIALRGKDNIRILAPVTYFSGTTLTNTV